MKKIILLVTIMFAGLHAAGAAESAAKIIQCMRSNAPDSVGVRDISLTTTDRLGKVSKLIGRIYSTREHAGGSLSRLRTLLQVDEPENLAGSAYLLRETEDYLHDGMYVYLPSVGRVRRLTGSFAGGSLLGTAFSCFDFKQFISAFGDFAPTAIEDGTLQGRSTKMLRFTPLPGAETPYTAAKTWIDTKACLPLQVDFFEGDAVVKRLTAPESALTRLGEVWYLNQVRMTNLTNGSHSVLKVRKITMDAQISTQYFNPETFYLVR